MRAPSWRLQLGGRGKEVGLPALYLFVCMRVRTHVRECVRMCVRVRVRLRARVRACACACGCACATVGWPSQGYAGFSGRWSKEITHLLSPSSLFLVISLFLPAPATPPLPYLSSFPRIALYILMHPFLLVPHSPHPYLSVPSLSNPASNFPLQHSLTHTGLTA